jgi:hypothetical protein
LMAYGGEMSGTPPALLKMLPVWFSVGDRDNIVGYRTINHTCKFDASRNLVDCDWLERLDEKLDPPLVADERLSFHNSEARTPDDDGTANKARKLYYDEDRVTDPSNLGTISFNLAVALPSCELKTIIEQCCINAYYSTFWPKDAIAFPEGNSYHNEHAASKAPASQGGSLFHLSAARNVVFSADEAKGTFDILSQINLPRRVQHFLTEIDFSLPQQNSTVQTHFCNEDIYGKFTFLEAVGLLRLYTDDDLLSFVTPFIPIRDLAQIISEYASGDEGHDVNVWDGHASTSVGTEQDILSRPDWKDFLFE